MTETTQQTFKTAFDSNDVMAYILGLCQQKKLPWNITKAQKLLYCCYGTILAGFGERLTDENPQAWQYGPVFPRTFNGIKNGRVTPGKDNGFSEQCNPKWLTLIDQTVAFFGRYAASQLSEWSHKAGSPWDRATYGGRELDVQIPNGFVREYFSKMVSNARTDLDSRY